MTIRCYTGAMETFGRILHVIAILAFVWFWGACYIDWKRIKRDDKSN